MLNEELGAELLSLKEAGLGRSMPVVEPIDATNALVDGRKTVLFSGNDYLGLSRHPRVLTASKKAIDQFGASATASRLINGNHRLYTALEEELAALKGTEAALVFSSGYATNVGTIAALASSREDWIFMDRLNHASLYDAAAQSRAKLKRYGHGISAALENLLRASEQAGQTMDRKLIVTDGVFSMDGDVAPLQEIRRIADKHHAIMVVDDAHGTGVLGPNGAGSCAAAGIQPEVEIGTLSKALGSLGGFVAGDRTLIDYLTNRARPLIFSTGLPPACVAAAHAAIRVMAEEPWRQTRLHDLSAWTRTRLEEAGFKVLAGETPILPIMVGDERRATALASGCLERGAFIPAIRTPSVPRGQARLRMTISAEHSEEQVTRAIEVLVEANRKAPNA